MTDERWDKLDALAAEPSERPYPEPAIGDEAFDAMIAEGLAEPPASPEPTPGLREAPFVVRQFEGQAWVPLREAVRLHEAHQDAVLTIAGLRNAAALAASPAPEPTPGLREAAQAVADWTWGMALAGSTFEGDAMALVERLRAALNREAGTDER